ncbi:MAG: hypothetical protein ABI334_03610 [Candidatus Dormiibacterota bacterium]
MLAIVMSACVRPSTTGSSAQPAQLYGAAPTTPDVQSLLGDSNWWPGPPSFGVRPLDSATMPFNEKFHVITRFSHIGTAETFDVEYTVWNSTASATTQMSNIQSSLGTPVTGTKAGDQTLYYGQTSSGGAAPYGTATFIRLGQIVITSTLSLKDASPPVSKLGRIATRLVSRLKDVLSGKVKVAPLPGGDTSVLPPPGPDLTLLGSVELPIEAVIVMLGFASPEALAGVLKTTGVDHIVFGDYALDNDTHMEVRAGVFGFITSQDADTWFNALRGSTRVDELGIATFYDDASGQYFSLFTAGAKGAILVCRSTSDLEAASRACESPLSRVAPAWQGRLATG